MLPILEIEVFKIFALVLVRCSGLLVAAPVLGSRNFPMTAKAGLAALLAFLITPLVPVLPGPLPSDALLFAAAALGELVIGLALGFVMTILFAAIQLAGQMIDMLSGFGLVNVFNPALETQVPIYGFFLFILAVLLLLATDGHHMMLEQLRYTFEVAPPGQFNIGRETLWLSAQWGRDLFIQGLLIGAPMAGALFLTYVIMGLLGRIVPQIQLFVVGFPVTVAMSLLIGALGVQLYLNLLDSLFDRMWRDAAIFIQGLG